MNRNYILICISLLLWGLGESMFFIFQSLYLEEWGASPVLIGTLLSINGIALAVAMLPSGYLSDKLGPRPLIWASWIVGAVAAWGMALANSLPLFVIAMAVYYSSGFAMPPLNSYIVRVRGKFSVERALTLTSVMYNVGAVIGPTIGGIIGSTMSLKSIYSFSASIMIISVIIILFIQKLDVEKAEPQAVSNASLKRFHPRFWAFVVLSAFIVFAIYMPQPLNANFLQNIRGLNVATIGNMGTIGNLGNVIVMLALGSLPAYYGILAGIILVGFFSLLILQGNSAAWYAAAYFLYGGFRLGKAMIIAFARNLVEPHKLGLAYGFLESVNSISLILAPLLAGFLYQIKPESVYSVNLFLLAGMFIINAVFLARIGKNAAIKNLEYQSNEEM